MYCKVIPCLKQISKVYGFAELLVLAAKTVHLPLDHGGRELGQMCISLTLPRDDMTLIASFGVLKPVEQLSLSRFHDPFGCGHTALFLINDIEQTTALRVKPHAV